MRHVGSGGGKKEIRKHESAKKHTLGSYESKYFEQTSTKATIGYLKEMLAYLRTSSDNNSKTSALTSQNKSALPGLQYGSLSKTNSLAYSSQDRGQAEVEANGTCSLEVKPAD